MYVSIHIDKNKTRSFVDIAGTPEDIAQTLQHIAGYNDTLKAALDLISDNLCEKTKCECGKLSKPECEMKCIAPTVYPFENPVSFTPNFPIRTDDQGNDDGAYADDDPSDD